MLALVVIGAADNVSVVIRSTVMQIETPDEMRGRVAAVNGVFIGASNELGEFESGATAALMGPVASVVLGGAGYLFKITPTGFLPSEDQGAVFAEVQLPEGASVNRTEAVVKRVEEIARNTPGVASVSVALFAAASRMVAPFRARALVPVTSRSLWRPCSTSEASTRS